MLELIRGYGKILISSIKKSNRTAAFLPSPSGPFKVGTRRMTFDDKARAETFGPKKGPRRLAVQFWYPAVPRGEAKALYTPAKGVARHLSSAFHMPAILNGLDSLETSSYKDAEIDKRAVPAPLLIFSHGYTGFEGQNTIQMEHLASHGYMVASICHTYEAFATEIDGNIVPMDGERIKEFNSGMVELSKQYDLKNITPEKMLEFMEKCQKQNQGLELWVQDTVFVAEEILGMNAQPQSPFFGAVDTEKTIGLFGHSYGGATSHELARRDGRFGCFVNMDGAPYGVNSPERQGAVGMVLASDSGVADIYSARRQKILAVKVPAAKHMDYSDISYTCTAIKKSGLVLGSVPGEEIARIMNDYLLAFFNCFVKGEEPEDLIIPGKGERPGVEKHSLGGWSLGAETAEAQNTVREEQNL